MPHKWGQGYVVGGDSDKASTSSILPLPLLRRIAHAQATRRYNVVADLRGPMPMPIAMGLPPASLSTSSDSDLSSSIRAWAASGGSI